MARAATLHMFPGILLDDVVFTRSAFGRPEAYRDSTRIFDYNISHDGDFVSIVFGPAEWQFGIDIVHVKTSNNWDEFIAPFLIHFTSHEIDWILTAEDNRYIRFSVVWALKESALKAIGIGIAMGLSMHSFRFQSGSPSMLPNLLMEEFVIEYYNNDIRQENWTFTVRMIDNSNEYVYATAIHGNKPTESIDVKFVDWDSIATV